MDYKQKNQKFARNHKGIGFYEIPLPLLHTVKSCSNTALKKIAKKPLCYVPISIVFEPWPLGKLGKNPENLHKIGTINASISACRYIYQVITPISLLLK